MDQAERADLIGAIGALQALIPPDVGQAPLPAPTSNPMRIEHGDYLLTHPAAARNQVRVESSRYGQWVGHIASAEPPRGAVAQRLSFEFSSDSLFVPGNLGHIAVGLRADSHFEGGDLSTLRLSGRGIVIGNVGEYSNSRPGCPATSSPNCMAIETWWLDPIGQTNAVLGWTESPELQNNRRYRVAIEARNVANDEAECYIAFILEEWLVSGWRVIADRVTYDYTPALAPGGGWFLLEVFSEHGWTMQIRNVIEEWE